MQAVEQFVQDWGYIAVFLGACIEGESVMLVAGTLCYSGLLILWKVMLVAFVGTLCADQGLFLVGHFYGPRLRGLFKKHDDKVIKIKALLHKYDKGFILSFRFIWGIRMLTPVVLGALNIPLYRFMYLNFFAAIIWTILSCGGAYLLARSLDLDLNKFSENFHYYFLIFSMIILSIVAMSIFQLLRAKKNA